MIASESTAERVTAVSHHVAIRQFDLGRLSQAS